MYIDAFIMARAILCILLYFLREFRILIPHFICTQPIATTMYDIRVNKLLFRSIYLSRDLSVIFRIESLRVLRGKISFDPRGRSSSGNNCCNNKVCNYISVVIYISSFFISLSFLILWFRFNLLINQTRNELRILRKEIRFENIYTWLLVTYNNIIFIPIDRSRVNFNEKIKVYDKVGANEKMTQLTYKGLCRWSRIRTEGASTSSVQYILHKVSIN